MIKTHSEARVAFVDLAQIEHDFWNIDNASEDKLRGLLESRMVILDDLADFASKSDLKLVINNDKG